MRITKAITIATTMIDRKKCSFFISIIIVLCSVSSSPAYSEDPPNSHKWQRTIEKKTFDETLLIEALTFCTNCIRSKKKLPLLQLNAPLQIASKKHSDEMARSHYFSHQSPSPANRTLKQRFANENIPLENVAIAENIAVDFVLAISEVPYYIEKTPKGNLYINAKTKLPIKAQSYYAFAKRLTDLWMASPGHRKNMVNPVFTQIGFGVCFGKYQGLDAIYVTQNFLGNISKENLYKYK